MCIPCVYIYKCDMLYAWFLYILIWYIVYCIYKWEKHSVSGIETIEDTRANIPFWTPCDVENICTKHAAKRHSFCRRGKLKAEAAGMFMTCWRWLDVIGALNSRVKSCAWHEWHGMHGFRAWGNVEVDASLTESLTEEALIARPDGPTEMERQPSRSPSMASRPSRLSSRSSRSHQSVHVQVPDGVKPGEKFFVVVDDMEYEVWAPEGSSPGEMVAMDVYKDPVESQKALTASRESGKSRRKGTNTSEPESVATDGSLVYVQIPDGSGPGETFFTDVNGFEYEILVPSTCQSGDLIYLEVPAKRTMGKFVVPENSPAALPYDAPSIFTALSDPFSDTSRSDHLADIRVPTGVQAGQTFVVIIDGVEFEVPVPASRLFDEAKFLFRDQYFHTDTYTIWWSLEDSMGFSQVGGFELTCHDVPSEEGYGAGDLMSLQLPSKGISPDPVTAAARCLVSSGWTQWSHENRKES